MWFLNNLDIHLYNEEIVLRGERDTASGHTLRGYVLLNLRNSSKITSLQLTLQGIACIPSESSEIFVQHKIEFLEETDVTKSFESGTYMYQFELPFTGDQPETVNSRNGSIKYMLKAVAKREGFPFQSDLKCERPIKVQRIHSMDQNEMDPQELLKFGEIQGELGFTIYSNSNSYQPGQDIGLKVGTKLFNPRSRIESIQACIIEVVKYHTKNGNIKSTKRPLAETIKYEDLRKRQPAIDLNLLQIPVNLDIQPDCKNAFLSISHSIEVQICLLSSLGAKKYILVRTPIHLSNKEVDTLPLYTSITLDSPPAYC
ncbi:hypothetical protein K7432_003477 [Basidiobolus ranarum]|uniref:Arrestin C-terminal-like domain-containing protein n=1 Tax=Basidiobolus ranarum TaxID=34480 RepID=A0ABR2W6B1_9FUNG